MRHAVERPAPPRRGAGEAQAVDAEQHVVEPKPRLLGRRARHQREHARPGVEPERGDRRRAEVRAILAEIVDREARQVHALRAQFEIGDGESVPDRRHLLIERAHGDERLFGPGLRRRGARRQSRERQPQSSKQCAHRSTFTRRAVNRLRQPLVNRQSP
jgi:hypothetical protein